jgi:hypothetical protein
MKKMWFTCNQVERIKKNFTLDVMMQEFLGDHYVLEKHANEGPKVANANGGAQGS